jgi:predicted ArsR family transcriptional regulator
VENAKAWGPLPPAPPSPALSRSRAEVLGLLDESDRPRTLAEVADVTNLHVNTVREHLEALRAIGLVRREAAPSAGRGRPAWLYRAVRRNPPTSEYAGLATALAATLHRTSPQPVQDAVAAGTEWGHEVARAAGAPSGTDHGAARHQVVRVLEQMGFEPEADAEDVTVRLTRCPLLDAARRHPDIVCGVHLGIARGALQEYDADDSAVALEPFAQPDACLLHLAGTVRA